MAAGAWHVRDARIVGHELEVDVEDAALVAAALGPRDAAFPEKEAVGRREGDGAKVLLLKVGDLAVDALEGHLEGMR